MHRLVRRAKRQTRLIIWHFKRWLLIHHLLARGVSPATHRRASMGVLIKR